MYRDLSDQVKINHVFSCSGNPLMMMLEMRRSNLPEHRTVIHKASKVQAQVKAGEEDWPYSESKLMMVKCKGLNLYRAVEIYLKYPPTIPPEFHDNELYAAPTLELWLKIKVEKAEWSNFHRAQKAKKYAAKERLKGMHSTKKLVGYDVLEEFSVNEAFQSIIDQFYLIILGCYWLNYTELN